MGSSARVNLETTGCVWKIQITGSGFTERAPQAITPLAHVPPSQPESSKPARFEELYLSVLVREVPISLLRMPLEYDSVIYVPIKTSSF